MAIVENPVPLSEVAGLFPSEPTDYAGWIENGGDLEIHRRRLSPGDFWSIPFTHFTQLALRQRETWLRELVAEHGDVVSVVGIMYETELARDHTPDGIRVTPLVRVIGEVIWADGSRVSRIPRTLSAAVAL